MLVALVGALGVPLEQRRCGCQGKLYEGRLLACSHRGNQLVGGRSTVVLEAVHLLCTLGEDAVLLESQHAWRGSWHVCGVLQARVGIGAAQGGLDERLSTDGTGERHPRLPVTMNLEAHRWLTG